VMNKTSRKSLKPGDVIEVAIGDSYSYLQFVGKHADYGDVVRVIPDVYDEPAKSHEFLVEADGYIAFYSATQSVRQGLTSIVGNVELPSEVHVPKILRRAGARGDQGKILTWFVEKNGVDSLRRTLSDEERSLPIAAVWDHELLKIRILENYRPEREGT